MPVQNMHLGPDFKSKYNHGGIHVPNRQLGKNCTVDPQRGKANCDQLSYDIFSKENMLAQSWTLNHLPVLSECHSLRYEIHNVNT